MSASKKRDQRLGDTKPMRPVDMSAQQYRHPANVSVKRYRRPVSQSTQGKRMARQEMERRSAVRSGYESYQREIDRRRKVLNTPGPMGERRRVNRRPRRTGLAAIIYRLRHRTVEKEQYFDYDMLLVIVFLMCFGLVMLYSTSAYSAQTELGDDMFYFSKQALIGVLGFAVMYVVSRIDYHMYGAFAFEIYLFSMLMMFLVRTPLGVELNGARRWIKLPGNLTLQPAEITKIAVILFIAYELCRMGRRAYTLKGMFEVGAFGAVAAAGVLFFTENLSTAIIVMAITCILIFVIHPKTKPFVMLAGTGVTVIAVGVAVLSVTVAHSDASNFRLRRIISWLNPEATADSGSYQLLQGLYAIGSGGLFGKGLGNSTQKLTAIPEAQNDMILAVICEELGIFGVVLILILFGLLLYRLMFIARNAPDLYGSLIATGIFAHIALQVVLNIAVVTGILPTTGITLPFISYGGTAVVFLLAEMGVALGISRKIRLEGEE